MMWLGLALLGIVAGTISGLLGIGGAIIIVPALVLAFGFSQHQAQGTSLAALLLPVGLFAVWRYYQAGQVNIKAAAVIAGAFLVGGLLGAHLAQWISGVWLRRIFGGLLLLLALRMLWDR